MKMLLEYQQNPRFHSADTALRQAEAAAIRVYTNERVSERRVCHAVALGAFTGLAPIAFVGAT